MKKKLLIIAGVILVLLAIGVILRAQTPEGQDAFNAGKEAGQQQFMQNK